MGLSKVKQAERDRALEQLREWLPPGSTVYCVLRHVSRSGMQREISLHYVRDGEMYWVSGLAARALGYRLGKRDGLIIGGCGMDMGFAIVHELASALYPQGFTCTGERCSASDHSNGDRDHTPHQHASGGYALKHRWV